MDYETFKETLFQELKDCFPTCTLSIQTILKNNQVSLDGLTIMEDDTNISPTIYLNYYYDNYTDGDSLDKIKSDIIHTYEKNQPDGKIDVSFFTNYENVRTKIVYKLINYEKNKQLLEDVPYFEFLDLAIVFYCLVSTNVTGSATILIHNKHLAFWDITKDALYQQALKNTPSLLSYDLRSLTEIMKELLSSEQENELLNEENAAPYPMYVLSNQNKLNGASCILYQDLLKNFSDYMNCDLYILPSSIHEVIIIPAYDDTSYDELSDMVKEVNETQVSEEEILSNHVYYFSRATKAVSM